MTTSYNSLIFSDKFSHIGLCAGNKSIKQTITIDDGTGKFYTYELSKSLVWVEYNIIPDFTTNPESPSIVESTTIIPNIDDRYNVVDENPITYVSLSETIEGVQENESIQMILSTPKEENVTQIVNYFTGWEIKSESITKLIKKTNMPPIVSNTLEASCYTVPQHLFTSCSTDLENSDPSSLSTQWFLYIDKNSYVDLVYDPITTKYNRVIMYDKNNATWELIKTHNGFTFYWVYSEEGRYKVTEKTTDIDGASASADRYENIAFAICETIPTVEEGSLKGAGEINVNPSRWQLIAIPLEFSYWDKTIHKFRRGNKPSTIYNSVILQLEDRYNRPVKDLFKVANAYIGTINKFYNFVPNFTRENSVHNFPLIYVDESMNNSAREIVGFWIKSNDIPFTIRWEII